jgi:DNA-binding response OmpR family regulator
MDRHGPVRILLVEDNSKLAAAIARGLQAQGYSTDVCGTGFEAEELAADEPYDLVLLDRMLPDRDGLDVCRNLRRRGVKSPVLMLTALSAIPERVAGLDAGADDYLTKPFEFEELLARIRALLRRGQATEATRLAYAGLELDLLKRTVERDGRRIKLSAKEFALLELLLRNADRVIDRMTIAQKVWDIQFEPASNVIDVYISSLRRKIDLGFPEPLIQTVFGTGYRLGRAEAPEPAP